MAAPEFTVESADGTTIGVFVAGEGPALVMVHGSIADHTTFDDLVVQLAPTTTSYRMDRRGFGASGDADAYAIEREYEDVAAVVAAVVRREEAPVALFGHSYGANCALGAAVAVDDVARLVLYEPSFGLTYPDGCIDTIEAALDRGDRDAAIVEVLSTILEMTEADIDRYRRSPVWPERLRSAHTIPRECRVEQERSFDDADWTVRCPTLVLTGSDTTDELATIARAAVGAVDGARLTVLDGQDHLAHRSSPQLVAEHIAAFLRGR
ncbi:MAG: alpha/beta hydrolase [Acidimicrobiaceae bacterium]|nr:alpha/beta hydrolase [Acidimicrobiaceae bacterium]